MRQSEFHVFQDNGCRLTHGKPCVHMHGTWSGYKWDGYRFIEGERSKKERKEKGKGKEGKKEKKEKRERKRRKRERERERKRENKKSALWWSKFIEPRSKVCIFDEGYAPRGRDSS